MQEKGGLGGGSFVLIFVIPTNPLPLLILRERDYILLRATLSGSVWDVFLSKAINEDIICGFCDAPDNDSQLFGECPFFTPFWELRQTAECASLMKRDRTTWPRCTLWHGWLPGLTARQTRSPRAVAASDLASHDLEKSL